MTARTSPDRLRPHARSVEECSVGPKAGDVSQTVKTNVVMTALKALEPQSQRAQDRTAPRRGAGGWLLGAVAAGLLIPREYVARAALPPM
ncbi:hypothetical protein GCM10009595_01990 [Falsarthrobacter nasiphocae]